MTLFEAIRELKEGQAICGPLDSDERPIIAWHWCNSQPAGTFSRNMRVELHCHDCRIIDLPKPKMSLEEGLEKVERDVFVEVAETDTGTVLYALWSKRPSISKAILSKLRSLPIDWQAEADRKKGK